MSTLRRVSIWCGTWTDTINWNLSCGIAIHGFIYEFSRHIVWLHVNTTNNDPRVIVSYYIDVVQECGGCPWRVRADKGMQNVNVAWRTKQDSFVYGKSVHNQRIESWRRIQRDHYLLLAGDGKIHKLKKELFASTGLATYQVPQTFVIITTNGSIVSIDYN